MSVQVKECRTKYVEECETLYKERCFIDHELECTTGRYVHVEEFFIKNKEEYSKYCNTARS